MNKQVTSEQDILNQIQTLLEGLCKDRKQELITQGVQLMEANLACNQSSKLDTIDQDHIVLNVGGKLFTVSLITLISIPDSLLDKLVHGRIPILTDENGHFFLDRNPDYFPYVLEYIRDGNVIFPSDPFLKKRIILELKHFEVFGNQPIRWKLNDKDKSADIVLADDFTSACKNGYEGNSVVFGTEEFVYGIYEWCVEILEKNSYYCMAFGVCSKNGAYSSIQNFSYSNLACISTQGAAYLLQPQQIPVFVKGDILQFTFDAETKKLTCECPKKDFKCQGTVSGENLYPFFYFYGLSDKIKIFFK